MVPDPPDFLSELGKQLYFTKTNQLIGYKILSPLDLEMIINYCHYQSIAWNAEAEIAKSHRLYKDKNGEPRVNPWHRISMDASEKARQFGCLFGFSPADRTRIKQAVNDRRDDADDDFT